MTRETILEDVLKLNGNAFIVTMGTGVGKTRVAIEKAIQLCKNVKQPILVLAPRISIIKGWQEEFAKWGYEDWLEYVTFSTYVPTSIEKCADRKWKVCICDEAHHITEAVADIMSLMSIENFIGLSATINRTVKSRIRLLFPTVQQYDVKTREAIDNEILPELEIYTIPLKLSDVKGYFDMVVRPNAEKVYYKALPLTTDLYWKANKAGSKDTKYILRGTALEYHSVISSIISTYKNKSNNPFMKNKWLHYCNERLKWLARLKTDYAKQILKSLNKQTVLTFCCDIEQSKTIGNSINSKDGKKLYMETLDKFNDGKLKHISSIDILSEGVNLKQCRIGLFAHINASDIKQIQKVGRILRHKKPIIILPYFKNTREQEIVTQLVQGYNPDNVHEISSFEDIKLK